MASSTEDLIKLLEFEKSTLLQLKNSETISADVNEYLEILDYE